MKVLVYFGHHKVGSTALQAFFARNSLKLLKHGILYPGVESEALSSTLSAALGRTPDDVHTTLNVREPHNALAFQMMSRAGRRQPPPWHPTLPSVPQMIRAMRMQARFLAPHTVVLCSEVMSNFGKVDPELIERILKIFPDAEYEFYCTLRRPDEYMISWQGQRLKFGDKIRSLSAGEALHYPNTIHFDYRALLEPWIHKTRGAPVHLRNYADVLAAGGSVEDFTNHLGIKLPALLKGKARANPSLPRAAMEIVRRGNHDLSAEDANDLRHYFLNTKLDPIPNADVEMYGEPLREDLFNRFSPIHDFLSEITGKSLFFPNIGDMKRTRPVPEADAVRHLLGQVDPATLPSNRLRTYLANMQHDPALE